MEDAMATIFEISMSLDGFSAGPDATLEEPLGKGGEQLHEWVFGLASWREAHGLDGGEHNADSDRLAQTVAATGATVMGRRMFSGGAGAWEDDPNANGWWGDTPPFAWPVFVVTHHAREPLVLGDTTFTFLTDGVEAAVEQARAAAGDRNVVDAGGADVGQQAIRAGLVDELVIHQAPVQLGGGVRTLEGLGGVRVELVETIPSEAVTHLRYRVETA
jgi:dihydrofolate reductase